MQVDDLRRGLLDTIIEIILKSPIVANVSLLLDALADDPKASHSDVFEDISAEWVARIGDLLQEVSTDI